ncbi:hypothetical protein [Micromonospora sp. NPDC007230]|uniref:hypothetical protein n=1 Tax=Micromonospora sp. NPDC007230 TaxID=3364237 RepID=UPI0036990847
MVADYTNGTAVYLDNATIYNACSALLEPDSFDAYKLMDLETFCQAFLLHSKVITLVGHSYQHRVQRHPIIAKQLLKTGVLVHEESSISYHGLESVDEAASRVDLKRLVEAANATFPDGAPWVGDLWADTGLAKTIILGSRTPTSYSYPFYSFSRELLAEAGVGTLRAGEHDSRGWVRALTAQTFFYVHQAVNAGTAFMCSAVRVPVVAELLQQSNQAFLSVAQATLGSAASAMDTRTAELRAFFGEHFLTPLRVPALRYVLNNKPDRTSFIAALLAAREDPKICEFRRWCGALQSAWETSNLKRVMAALSELRSVSDRFDPDVTSATSLIQAPATGLVDAQHFGGPALAFLADIHGDLLGGTSTTRQIERLIEQPVDDDTVSQYHMLRQHWNTLHSPGRIVGARQHIQMEVHMGDRFEQVHGSVIVNRSVLNNSFNSIANVHGQDVADAIRRIAVEVERSGSQEAAENLEALTEELQQPQPKRGVLRALWKGIVEAVPTITQATDAAERLTKLFS